MFLGRWFQGVFFFLTVKKNYLLPGRNLSWYTSYLLPLVFFVWLLVKRQPLSSF